MTPLMVLFVGLLLVFLEFYLPGGVMGAAGAVLIITSIVLYALSAESALYTFIFVIGAIMGTIVVIRGALWSIRRTGKARSIFLDSDQEGYRAEKYNDDLIGTLGRASCDLKPGGFVHIGGKKYAAISVSGFIPVGSEIEVIGVEGETVKVKQKG